MQQFFSDANMHISEQFSQKYYVVVYISVCMLCMNSYVSVLYVLIKMAFLFDGDD